MRRKEPKIQQFLRIGTQELLAGGSFVAYSSNSARPMLEGMIYAATIRLMEIVVMFLSGIYFGFIQDFNLLEIAFALAILWAIKRGTLPALSTIGRLEDAALRAIKLRWLRIVGVPAIAILLRVALLPVLPMPRPVVADEFSHLLLADTLLHGRLANPTHPFWIHFESLHIIQRPHYVSNYFPGQAIILAAAIRAAGNPWIGILALSGAFSAALFWMLRGWFTTRWAVFGTMLAILRFGIGSYWINGYHGGFLAAIGGALVAGAYARLRKRIGLLHSIVFGVGCVLMLINRPFEGFFFAAAMTACLAVEVFRRGREFKMLTLARFVVPVATVVTLAATALGFYFSRVTGSPLVTTYAISQRTYGWPMALAWVDPPRVVLSHVELQRYYDYEVLEHTKVSGILNFVEYITFRLQEYWRFFLGPVLTLALLGFSGCWKARRYRPLIIGAAAVLAAVLGEGASSPHYMAPAAACIVAIVVACFRQLSAVPVGIFLRRAAPLVMILVLALRITAQNAGLPYTQKINFQSWCCKVQGNYNKARIEDELRRRPGTHLVFVKTKTEGSNLFQWIYNEADIDGAKIVWARDLGPEENARLRSYFAGRECWLVDPNLDPSPIARYADKGEAVTALTGRK
jgi:hypothetical protein